MTALADEKIRDHDRINKIDVTFTASKIWKGARVGLILSGTGAGKFAEMGQVVPMRHYGRAMRTYDASAADKAGTIELEYEIVAEWLPQVGSVIVDADFGKRVTLLDDQTVALATEATPGLETIGWVMKVDTLRGVRVALDNPFQGGAKPAVVAALPAYVSNDSAPASIIDGAIYDVATTAAATTISLPANPRDGIRATIIADGTKNGHTVTIRDVATAISAAYTASKRLHISITSLGGKWFAAGVVGP